MAGLDRLEDGARAADQAPRADAVGVADVAVEAPGQRAHPGERDDRDDEERHPLRAEGDVGEGQDGGHERRRWRTGP